MEPFLKKLIVNADDFGFTHDVNDGIVEAHRSGILTSTTIMAVGAAFDHAVSLARRNPSLGVGVHLVLVGEPGFPQTPARLLVALAARRLDVDALVEEQIRRVLAAGVRATHLDSHKHTHLVPAVLSAVARAAERHGIRWVRRTLPMEFPVPGLAPWSARVLARHGCRMVDRFLGFRETGRFDSAALASIIRRLPGGVSEFMCHPGHCGTELQAARTRLKQSRQRELTALVSPEVRDAVAAAGVRLASYADLAS
ncbi:MAG: ChbG/HpnK family deacetylase [Bryobacteraceae bacterium]